MDSADHRKGLGQWMEDRRGDLDMTLDDLAATSGLSAETLRQAGGGRKMRVNTKKRIERALQWEAGSVDRILRGFPPILKPQPQERSAPPELRDDVERKLWSLDLPETDRWWFIQAHRLRTSPPPPSSQPGGNTRSA